MKGISKLIDAIHKIDVGVFVLTVTNDPELPYIHISLQTKDRKLEVNANINTEEQLWEWLPIAKQMLTSNSETMEQLNQVSLPPLGKSLLSDI